MVDHNPYGVFYEDGYWKVKPIGEIGPGGTSARFENKTPAVEYAENRAVKHVRPGVIIGKRNGEYQRFKPFYDYWSGYYWYSKDSSNWAYYPYRITKHRGPAFGSGMGAGTGYIIEKPPYPPNSTSGVDNRYDSKGEAMRAYRRYWSLETAPGLIQRMKPSQRWEGMGETSDFKYNDDYWEIVYNHGQVAAIKNNHESAKARGVDYATV